jgi:uncharacterized membrane protein YheB (UPF0754 family)
LKKKLLRKNLKRTVGQKDSRTKGQSDKRTEGQKERRTEGQKDKKSIKDFINRIKQQIPGGR